MKKDVIKVKGTIIKAFPSAKFLVKFDDYAGEATCVVGGKLRQNKIKLVENDKVDVELSPYDLSVGRISWRY